MLLCGDFNAHSEEWGSVLPCHNGNNLNEAMLETGFNCLNDGTATTLSDPHNHSSVIDLAIIHASLALRFRHTILSDTWSSDYYPLTIQANLLFQNTQIPQRRHRLHTVNTNWGKFKTFLEIDIRKRLSDIPDNVHTLYPTFICLIEQALFAAFAGPRSRSNDAKSDPPNPKHPPHLGGTTNAKSTFVLEKPPS